VGGHPVAITGNISNVVRRAAFSLIELIVVIGIIAILIALLMPTLSRVRLHAQQVKCAAQLHQLGTGLANYAVAFRGHYPVVGDHHAYGGDGTGEDHEGPGWTEELEPYYAKVTKGAFHCPSFPEDTINYFLGLHYIRIRENRFDLMTSDIQRSSEYILSGDCTHARLYCPPFGQSAMYLYTDDCDKDDMLWNCLAYFGEEYGMWAHPAGNNVLFADYHVAPFKRFDGRYMTYDPHNPGVDFNQVQPEP
jgi:prepilin-type N-terminal cleavage/methylation domain-containing protein